MDLRGECCAPWCAHRCCRDAKKENKKILKTP
jgi:hypothetical protein